VFALQKESIMQELTKAQEQILEIVWQLEECVVADVIAILPEPKPAYTTVATVMKVLEKKQYVTKRSVGKTHLYTALISKNEYRKEFFSGSFKRFFNGSLRQVVSFFGKESEMSLSELEELKKYVESEIAKQKKNE
jgi:predicted transcriptional regulator